VYPISFYLLLLPLWTALVVNCSRNSGSLIIIDEPRLELRTNLFPAPLSHCPLLQQPRTATISLVSRALFLLPLLCHWSSLICDSGGAGRNANCCAGPSQPMLVANQCCQLSTRSSTWKLPDLSPAVATATSIVQDTYMEECWISCIDFFERRVKIPSQILFWLLIFK